MGLRINCFFDVAFVTKWVRPRETLLIALTGNNLDGLEDQCFFDVAFVAKWVQP